MLFWDDFTADGELGPEPEQRKATWRRSACSATSPRAAKPISRSCWRGIFPIARRAGCGWTAPKGDEDTIIGNYYSHAFPECVGRGRHTLRRICPRLEKRPAVSPRRCARARCLARCSDAAIRQPVHAGHAHLLPHRRRRSSTASKAATTSRAAATATAPTSGTTRRPRATCFPRWRDRCARRPSDTRWTTQGAMHFRQMLPDGKERFGLRRRRRPDGPDHARLPGLEALRRHATGCADLGRASRRRSSSPGSPAAGTPTATA